MEAIRLEYTTDELSIIETARRRGSTVAWRGRAYSLNGLLSGAVQVHSRPWAIRGTLTDLGPLSCMTVTAGQMYAVRQGSGRPLLMLHGLGGSHRSWSTITSGLSRDREVIAVDLPGFGQTAPLRGETSIATLADNVIAFMRQTGLERPDVVGSSMGARLALELARRGEAGAVVSLDPGGFWSRVEKPIFETSIALSIRLVRALQPIMPAITGSPLGRTLLFPQFSARPWRLSPQATLDEMRDYAQATRFDELLHSLAHGPEQEGMPLAPSCPLVIGWGRQDRVCFPGQARKAMALFPHAQLHWFDHCGHFPHWDQPDKTVDLILSVSASS